MSYASDVWESDGWENLSTEDYSEAINEAVENVVQSVNEGGNGGDGNGGDDDSYHASYSPTPGGSLETEFTEDQPYYVNPISGTPIDLGFMGDPMGAIIAGRPFLEPSNIPLYMGGLPDVVQYPLSTYFQTLVDAVTGGDGDGDGDGDDRSFCEKYPWMPQCWLGQGGGGPLIDFPDFNLNIPGLGGGDLSWLLWLALGGGALLLLYKWATKKQIEVRTVYAEE